MLIMVEVSLLIDIRVSYSNTINRLLCAVMCLEFIKCCFAKVKYDNPVTLPLLLGICIGSRRLDKIFFIVSALAYKGFE